MAIELSPFIAGLIGGIVSWFVTQSVAEPLRRFLGMRRDIAQHLLDYDNVAAARDVDGKRLEQFDEQDAARLRDAQKKLREFATQTLSYVQTDAVATNLIRWLWRYDPMKAGRSLIGLSNTLGAYGEERHRHRNNIRDALRIKPLSS